MDRRHLLSMEDPPSAPAISNAMTFGGCSREQRQQPEAPRDAAPIGDGHRHRRHPAIANYLSRTATAQHRPEEVREPLSNIMSNFAAETVTSPLLSLPEIPNHFRRIDDDFVGQHHPHMNGTQSHYHKTKPNHQAEDSNLHNNYYNRELQQFFFANQNSSNNFLNNAIQESEKKVIDNNSNGNTHHNSSSMRICNNPDDERLFFFLEKFEEQLNHQQTTSSSNLAASNGGGYSILPPQQPSSKTFSEDNTELTNLSSKTNIQAQHPSLLLRAQCQQQQQQSQLLLNNDRSRQSSHIELPYKNESNESIICDQVEKKMHNANKYLLLPFADPNSSAHHPKKLLPLLSAREKVTDKQTSHTKPSPPSESKCIIHQPVVGTVNFCDPSIIPMKNNHDKNKNKNESIRNRTGSSQNIAATAAASAHPKNSIYESDWSNNSNTHTHLDCTTSGGIARRTMKLSIRPLNAYNFFFSDERERILSSHNNNNCQQKEFYPEEDYYTEERKKILLLRHLRKDRSKPRLHRKTHGKIDFQTLSREIGQRWKKLSNEKKQFYKDIALLDLKRHKKEISLQAETAEARVPPF